MQKTKLIVVGGFLGAGKTTSIIALAKKLLSDGKKVGIVTNDQGSRLVDTEYMQSQGLPVLEVTGGCFCCNFDEFTLKLSQLSEQAFPDYILAEPVGSCTDLVATIMKPLKQDYAGKFGLAPLSVVVDPKRLRRVLAEQESLFPNEINYLFKKQIEEADIIVLNKCDLLHEEQIEQMTQRLHEMYPAAELLAVSAAQDAGITEWASRLVALDSQAQDKASLDIAYPTYAQAEADLGWLNTTVGIYPADKVDPNEFCLSIAQAVRDALKASDSEIAHLKMYMVSRLDFCKLSCVSVTEDIVFDHRSSIVFGESSLILNIRAHAMPDNLRRITEEAVRKSCSDVGAEARDFQTEAFQPSYPRPRHRM